MPPQTWFGPGKGVLHHSTYKPGTRLVPFLLPAAGGSQALAYNANVFMAVKWNTCHLLLVTFQQFCAHVQVSWFTQHNYLKLWR